MQAALTHPHMQLVARDSTVTALDLVDAGLTPYETHVALRIMRSIAAESSESLAQISAGCGLNVKTVRAAISGLVEKGVMARMDYPGMPTEYTFNPRSKWTNPYRQTVGVPPDGRGTPTAAREGYRQAVGVALNQAKNEAPLPPDGRGSDESDRIKNIYIHTTTPPVENANDGEAPSHQGEGGESEGGEGNGSANPSHQTVGVDAPKFDADSWQLRYAETFRKRLEDAECLTPAVKRAPKKDRARMMQAWADVFDKLHRIDGHSTEHIANVLKWLFAPGNWWITTRNIQSAAKLRQKNDQDTLYFDLFSMKMDVVEKALPPLDLTQPIAARDLPRAIREHGLSEADFYRKGSDKHGGQLWMLMVEKRRELGVGA
jgi:hypothetical protein